MRYFKKDNIYVQRDKCYLIRNKRYKTYSWDFYVSKQCNHFWQNLIGGSGKNDLTNKLWRNNDIFLTAYIFVCLKEKSKL